MLPANSLMFATGWGRYSFAAAGKVGITGSFTPVEGSYGIIGG